MIELVYWIAFGAVVGYAGGLVLGLAFAGGWWIAAAIKLWVAHAIKLALGRTTVPDLDQVADANVSELQAMRAEMQPTTEQRTRRAA